MNRRSFLGILSGSIASFGLDPERLLWMPGAKTIFIPAPLKQRNLLGVCNGVLVYWDDIEKMTIGPQTLIGTSLYRTAELREGHHIGDSANTIFAIPGGRLQVCVR